jgi:hypothetical protein
VRRQAATLDAHSNTSVAADREADCFDPQLAFEVRSDVYVATAAGADRRRVALACGTKALAWDESETSCFEHFPIFLPPAPSWRP